MLHNSCSKNANVLLLESCLRRCYFILTQIQSKLHVLFFNAGKHLALRKTTNLLQATDDIN